MMSSTSRLSNRWVFLAFNSKLARAAPSAGDYPRLPPRQVKKLSGALDTAKSQLSSNCRSSVSAEMTRARYGRSVATLAVVKGIDSGRIGVGRGRVGNQWRTLPAYELKKTQAGSVRHFENTTVNQPILSSSPYRRDLPAPKCIDPFLMQVTRSVTHECVRVSAGLLEQRP